MQRKLVRGDEIIVISTDVKKPHQKGNTMYVSWNKKTNEVRDVYDELFPTVKGQNVEEAIKDWVAAGWQKVTA